MQDDDIVNLNVRVARDLRRACHLEAVAADLSLAEFVIGQLKEHSGIQQRLNECKKKKRKEKHAEQ